MLQCSCPLESRTDVPLTHGEGQGNEQLGCMVLAHQPQLIRAPRLGRGPHSRLHGLGRRQGSFSPYFAHTSTLQFFRLRITHRPCTQSNPGGHRTPIQLVLGSHRQAPFTHRVPGWQSTRPQVFADARVITNASNAITMNFIFLNKAQYCTYRSWVGEVPNYVSLEHCI